MCIQSEALSALAEVIDIYTDHGIQSQYKARVVQNL